MSEKLLIIMANSDPRNGEELGAPIFQATVAAAMEYEVEVICTATAGRLMKKGEAEKLVVKEGSPKRRRRNTDSPWECGNAGRRRPGSRRSARGN